MFKAAKILKKYIGGRMCRWKKGEPIGLDKETVIQNFEPGDYEANVDEDYQPVGIKTKKSGKAKP